MFPSIVANESPPAAAPGATPGVPANPVVPDNGDTCELIRSAAGMDPDWRGVIPERGDMAGA